MANAGQAVLTVAGGAVGAYFGNPALGAQIGGLVGQALFPTQLPGVEGPRLGDQRITSANIGAPVPQLYGTFRVAGNIIWAAPREEVATTEEQGGKGGPEQSVTTYSYFQSFAVGFCEGEIGAIRKLWINSKLVYDKEARFTNVLAGEAVDGLQNVVDGLPFLANMPTFADQLVADAASRATEPFFAFYPGSEDQEPDPTIEAAEGVGNTPAFRGLCYLVFDRLPLANFNNQIINVEAELIKKPEELPNDLDLYSPRQLPDWIRGSRDPRPENADFEYQFTGSGSVFDNIEDALSDADSLTGGPVSRQLIGWTQSISSHRVSPFFDVDPESKIDLFLHFNHYTEDVESYRAELIKDSTPCLSLDENQITPGDSRFYWTGMWSNGSNIGTSGVFAFSAASAGPVFSPPLTTLGGDESGYRNNCTSYPPVAGYFPVFDGASDVLIRVRRIPKCPCAPCDADCGEENAQTLPDDPDYCVLESGTVVPNEAYEPASGSEQYLGLRVETVSDGQMLSALGPVLRIGDARTESLEESETFWTAAYDAAVLAGLMESSLEYGVDYPADMPPGQVCVTPWNGLATDAIPTTLKEVVTAICGRHGLDASLIDVSRLVVGGIVTEPPSADILIDGYLVARAADGRAQLNQLRQFAQFDAVESDGKLKFVLRGTPALAAIPPQDLCAHEDGAARPPAMSVRRMQDVELPYQLRLSYAALDRDYQPGQQLSPIRSGPARSLIDIELPIALDATRAKKIVEIIYYDAWAGRTEYAFAVGTNWLGLEPTDPVLIPVDGVYQRARIASIDYTSPGILSLMAVSDDDGSYTSIAVGGSGNPVRQTPQLRGPTELVVMDLPLLRDQDNDPGYYIALRSSLSGWRGARLHVSRDDGDSYQGGDSYDRESVIGTATTRLPTGPTTIWDEGNTLTVRLREGLLESATESAVIAGANSCALGVHGRWEVLQFRTATQNDDGTWTLSGLLRGRRGTEPAVDSHQSGDTFVRLSIYGRVEIPLSELEQEVLLKMVTGGTAVQNNAAQAFTPTGEALRPFAPANFLAVRDDDDTLLSWQRRGRIGQELRTGSDIPLSEESEAYEVDVLLAGAVVRTIATSSPGATHTAAQQAEDGTSHPITYRVYQLSASVGRGHPSETTS